MRKHLTEALATSGNLMKLSINREGEQLRGECHGKCKAPRTTPALAAQPEVLGNFLSKVHNMNQHDGFLCCPILRLHSWWQRERHILAHLVHLDKIVFG